MNYYEHHIGDYIKATAHLSMVEDAAYRRLIDAYYTREIPLPAEKKACHRLARAFSKVEKDAVDTVLEEFFVLESDGWHQKRCDKELEKYSEKKPVAEEKKENDKERQRRARERRKALFEELSARGVNMPWNATTEQLQFALSQQESQQESQPSHEPVTQPVTRDNTCTHTPVTSNQSPVNPRSTSTVNNLTSVTPAGIVCGRLKSEARITDANPQHPKLIALLNAGLTDDEIVSAGHEACSKGKGFSYALAVAEGRRRDANSIKPLPEKPVGGLTRAGQATAEAAARWLKSEGEVA